MITIYEQRGIKKGIEKGIQQGIEKGKQDGIILLLEKKFRKLRAAEKRRILKIDSVDKLDRLLLSVLDAASLEELEF
jgi:predicted transposase YdaD